MSDEKAGYYPDEDLEDSNNSFSYFYKLYIEDAGRRCKISTMKSKINVFEKTILSYFSEMRICDITPKVIREWQMKISDPELGYSQGYLHNIDVQFKSFMHFVSDICDIKSNPCDRVRSMGSTKRRRSRYWTPEEYFAFRDATKVEPLAHTCFETLFWTGIRVGELLALSPEDVDYSRKEIHISKNFQTVSGKDYVWEPKTESSVRVILIPEFLADELKDHIDGIETFDKWRRIFPVDVSWLCYRIHKYAKIAGVREINVHGLRHSAASLLINKGFGALEVSHRLGHSKPSVTLNTYSHMFPSRQEAIVNLLDDVERGGSEGGNGT